MKINKRYKITLLLFISLSLISFSLYLTSSKKPLRLNILLITLDALRPDHLGCYGYKRNTSPNIDKLAKEGIMFTQAIAQGTWTPPSTVSIITSTYPSMHQVVWYGDSINPEISTLTEIFKRQNYHTGFISFSILNTIIGLNRGFDVFNADIENEDAHKLTQKAIKWLKRNKNKPFFLWLHYWDTHLPYKASPPYDKIFLNDGIYYDEKIKNLSLSDSNICVKCIPKYGIKDNITDGNYYISQYDGAIRSVDNQIGFLVNALKRLRLYKNTLIIISADHGELLGENDIYFQHGVVFSDAILKVPLIITHNKLIPKNKVINCQVQSIDIVPTILEILKIDKPPSMQGFSLLPVILGRNNYPSAYAFLYANEAAYGLRTSEWKLIYSDWEKAGSFIEQKMGRGNINGEGLPFLIEYLRSYLHKEKKELPSSEYILFNLKQDPQEQVNLINLEKERFMILKEKLGEFLNLGNHTLSITKIRKPLDKEMEEKLRSLGYVQ